MDTPLKQRLIGAIVLVALAVIFLPMLVKGPAPDSGVANVPIAAPDAPADGQFETRELPLVAPAGGATGLQSGQAKPVDEAAASSAPPTVDTSPAVAAGNYAVTFGAYGSQADADAVIAYLKRSQLPGFTETTTINGKQAWRVRVGPYADRAQAEAARLQAVKVRGDVKAEVITLDASAAPATAVAATPAAPSASTPVAAPSPAASNPVHSESLPASTPTAAAPPAAKPEPPKPQPKPEPAKPQPKPEATASKPEAPATPAAPAASGVGFAVQLGAFGQANDANALRDKVRAAGFSAFVEQVRTDKGTLHRVRVGPVANRADAEQLKAQVAAKVGVAGMVRPHP
ncbi:TPA: SPOR domain-containing protein [Stenotrophomonas maltophilia]|uniref:SPOR domain-containing protein n=1 Tax=Stenotrophomonas sp. TaxID=69392 RepID=UPI0028A7AE5B|nr:SPOR domain-containing protein [Stenotrophomonas sp.]HDS0949686.1 SPOR domain-containing protein [Stenotrophomonas maltophilia]HDS1025868.1 SPOR domain-containing protein [Stenotrophomonas maltophilia]HDS1034590.1 SPOR domain-containing protein [Stenotrophomonas maltophilia]HDS1038515.1 SPOR domain-containing protein [Stenotrophomonas maltophilia]HDS1042974.1 SPOR domain-containing protein [Stenotrophomonas maltophilia]